MSYKCPRCGLVNEEEWKCPSCEWPMNAPFKPDKPIRRDIPQMKCPECGREMEAGYLLAGPPGLSWNNKEFVLDPEPMNTEQTSFNRMMWGTTLPAFRCRNCDTIAFHPKVKKKKV